MLIMSGHAVERGKKRKTGKMEAMLKRKA